MAVSDPRKMADSDRAKAATSNKNWKEVLVTEFIVVVVVVVGLLLCVGGVLGIMRDEIRLLRMRLNSNSWD